MKLNRANTASRSQMPQVIREIIKHKLLYLFILPAVLLIAVFKYYPFISSIYHSFFQWNSANIYDFNGLTNYKNLFADRAFIAALKNILIVSLSTIAINLIFPFLCAELITTVTKGRVENFFTIGFIVPMVIPRIVVILLWRWIFAGDDGILNMLLSAVGLSHLTTPWMGDPSTALAAIIGIGFPWISGLPFLLYLNGLQSIPLDLYEVAELEGVGTLQRLRYIDIPMLSSQRKLIITYMLTQAIQMFDRPYLLTDGGPGVATMTPSLFIYQKAFINDQFGYSASAGVMLFLLVALLSFVNQTVLKESEGME